MIKKIFALSASALFLLVAGPAAAQIWPVTLFPKPCDHVRISGPEIQVSLQQIPVAQLNEPSGEVAVYGPWYDVAMYGTFPEVGEFNNPLVAEERPLGPNTDPPYGVDLVGPELALRIIVVFEI